MVKLWLTALARSSSVIVVPRPDPPVTLTLSVNSARRPSPDHATRSPGTLNVLAGKVVIRYRPPAGSTRYSVVGAGPDAGEEPGGTAVTGSHSARIHPGPTSDQGTAARPPSVPAARGASVVGGGRVVAGGADVDVVLATVPAVAAVVWVGEADPDRADPPPQPARVTTAATASQPRRTPEV